MKTLSQTSLHLILLAILAMPSTLLVGCGGDRYTCDTCGETQVDDPDENDAEDLAEILPLNFIEAAEFTVDDVTDIDRFDNYYNIDLRINTISEARELQYNEDDTSSNIAGIAAEYWNDDIETLSWETAESDLTDLKQRQFYLLAGDTWELNTTRNEHKLRRYDEKVYDFWLGDKVTIKWEIYEAKDRTNPSNIAYPSIAGKQMDEILRDTDFDPPILENDMARDSVLLWGENIPFTDTTNAEAKIFVVYKQYRPIEVDGDSDQNVIADGFLAFVPALPISANSVVTRFAFQPLSSATDADTFIAEFTGRESTRRFQVNDHLWISFNASGAEGAGAQGVMLWSSKTTDVEDGLTDYYYDNTNGNYLRVDIPMAQKASYKLETYENPLVAFVTDGVNDGTHLGWYYIPSGTLDQDNPLPHYAFNGAATSDIKTAFNNWRRQQYCDDSDHNDDPGRATICSGLAL